ncbi:hypothetical protein CBP27_10335, partial [Fischerella thermalis WC542]
SRYISNLYIGENHSNYPLLFDPQTSGGLLASIPIEQADRCLAALKGLGYGQSSVIGGVIEQVEGKQPVRLRG